MKMFSDSSSDFVVIGILTRCPCDDGISFAMQSVTLPSEGDKKSRILRHSLPSAEPGLPGRPDLRGGHRRGSQAAGRFMVWEDLT